MLPAVFFTSLSAIAYEILLTRVFSISQWNHLAFMVISLALLGFAASGIFLSIQQGRHGPPVTEATARERLDRLSLYVAASMALSFLFINHLPLDYFKLPLQPVQTVYLLAAYVSLALPFFFAGTTLSMAYIVMADKSGIVYFVSMAGSATGAVLPLILLERFPEGHAVMMTAVIPLLSFCFSWIQSMRQPHGAATGTFAHPLSKAAVAIMGVVFLVILTLTRPYSGFQVRPSDYKALSQTLQMPHTEVTRTFFSIRGRIDRVQSPYLRFFPGLSLAYNGPPPLQFAAFRDGDGQLTCYGAPRVNPWSPFHDPPSSRPSTTTARSSARPERRHRAEADDDRIPPRINAGFPAKADEFDSPPLDFPQYTLAYAGYALVKDPKQVLIIQNGGGTALPCALSARASHITVIERHPGFAALLQAHYGLPVISQGARSYITRTDQTFQVIHLENWGTSLPGTSALAQDFMFTRQAFQAYVDHLSADGVLILCRRLHLPPSQMVRLYATAFEALQASGFETPRRHLAVIRNWDTFVLILSRRPLTDASPLEAFARRNSFDMVWPQDPGSPWINRFNKFEAPFHYAALKELTDAYAADAQEWFFKGYALDAAPQTDNRPFPDKFFKWSRATSIHQMTGSRMYTLLMSGEMVVVVVFCEAVLVSAGLLLAPLFILRRRIGRVAARHVLYFLCIGAGFIWFEMYFINMYGLIFDDPILSFSLVLGGLLAFSSTGGIAAQHLESNALKAVIGVLCGVLLVMILILDALLEKITACPGAARIAFSLALMLPAGVLLGIPFPMGMRCLVRMPAHRAYMWAANGSAAVVAAIVAAQISISLGLKTLLWTTVVCYGAAWLAARVK